jgi:hypothetical protein
MRVPGDTLFTLGAIALVIFVASIRPKNASLVQDGEESQFVTAHQFRRCGQGAVPSSRYNVSRHHFAY